MRRLDLKAMILIAAAFGAGIVLNILARRILPGILPGAAAAFADLIATLIQIIVPAAGVAAAVLISGRRDDRK